MVLLSDYESSVSMSAEDLDESNGIENERDDYEAGYERPLT